MLSKYKENSETRRIKNKWGLELIQKQQQEFQELKDDLGSGRCGGLAEGIGPLGNWGRPEGAEAMPGKANEGKTWVMRSLQAWFSSLLLVHHLETENREGEMPLEQSDL